MEALYETVNAPLPPSCSPIVKRFVPTEFKKLLMFPVIYICVLLLSFLRSNSYKNKVTVKYFNFTEKDFNKDNFLNISLTNKEYANVDYLLTLLKLKKYIKEDLVKLPGSYNFVNFINMINNKENFIESLKETIEHFDEDIYNIASYLANKYSFIGLNKNYYIEYFYNL